MPTIRTCSAQIFPKTQSPSRFLIRYTKFTTSVPNVIHLSGRGCRATLLDGLQELLLALQTRPRLLVSTFSAHHLLKAIDAHTLS